MEEKMRSTVSLNGQWELMYSETRPSANSPLPDFYDAFLTDAVPGMWEDMIPVLQMAPYWDKVKFNPEFRPLRYPMTGTVPDMVLETVVGCFYYRRSVTVNADDADKRIIFRCAGVQNRGLLWVNGKFAGEHCGYSTPFSFDITELVDFGQPSELIFAVSNHESLNEHGEPISGCTSRAANRYTGGIIGAVSLELQHKDAIDDLYISAYMEDSDSFRVHAEISGSSSHTFRWEIYDGTALLTDGVAQCVPFDIPRDSLEFWTPRSPKLYTLRLHLFSDGVLTDTHSLDVGIRRLAADGYKLKLNGMPVYLRGICEHGYFARSVHPDPDISYYNMLIKKLKSLDFNFIRFHTWVPTEEYMTAADRLGMLLHIESPNNTTLGEWMEIMRFVRRHPSVVICCCGNELLIDETMIAHLERCADVTHSMAPGLLFSPMSALRGVEYFWQESNLGDNVEALPFKHNPERLKKLLGFSDLFSSYALGGLSYNSTDGDPETIDSFADTYRIPRLSHEICIHGTYADLGLEWRYTGTRIGESELYSSVRRILTEAGLLHRAPLYYINSCRWQQLLRKHCFENARLAGTLSGYDYLGDIDHHWHTFGYRAGMMNEFYEMKPGETVENVLRYNGESVLLCDLTTDRCFTSGDTVRIVFSSSLYGGYDLEDAKLSIRLETSDRQILSRFTLDVDAKNGGVSKLTDLKFTAPTVKKPSCINIYARLSDAHYEIENKWEIYVFPVCKKAEYSGIITTSELDDNTFARLCDGASVLLTGAGPLQANPMSFRISLAGRTAGNLATVIEEHPLSETFEHEGFCGWQFAAMMNKATCVYYSPKTTVPFDPIIEVASSYKWIRRQAALFELRVGRGRLLVCTFNLDGDSAAQKWWRTNLISYMSGTEFSPRTSVTPEQLKTLYSDGTSAAGSVNSNVARNTNDKTMKK